MLNRFGRWTGSLILIGLTQVVTPAGASTACQLGTAPFAMSVPDGKTVTLYTAPSVAKGASCSSVAVQVPCKAGALAGPKAARYAGCMPLEGFTGVNMNAGPEQLDTRLLQASGAHWVRAFVNVVGAKNAVDQGKRKTGIDLADWKAFNAVGADGTAKTILGLKWEFVTPGLHPPLPGSAEETALFAFLDSQILDPLAPTASIIVSGNEPFVNTLAADWEPNKAYGGIPLVIFYERVTAHVNDYLIRKGMRDQKKLFVGAFTRLYNKQMQKRPAVVQLMDFADKTPYVDGVDLHAHITDFSDIETSLKFAQRHTAKPLIVTEYTYVHAMQAALAANKPLGAGFAAQSKLAAGKTELEFLRCDVFHRGPGCKGLPMVSEAVWDDFVKSRPWFIDHFLLKADQVFRAHGVLGATFGLVGGTPSMEQLRDPRTPWYLGFLYAPGVLGDGPDGLPLPNYQYLDDFRQLTGWRN